MLGILLKAAVVLVAVAALPAPTPAGRGGSGGTQHQDDGGPSAYPNEPALAIGLISGSGLRRRSARLATLDQDFSSNAYDFADGGAEQRFRRQTRPGIVSPFGQTSDVEDEHRLRRADEGAAGGEDAAKLPEGSGQQEADVDGAHFPAQRRQNDGEDDLEQDSAVDRRRRGVADDEDDVYRDLDDPALPSWARGRAVAKRQAEDPVLQEDFLAEDDDEPVMLWARDSDRARRQVGEDLLTTPDSDEADYLRQRREEGAATTTEVSTATDGVTETEPSEVSSAPRNGGSEATTSASDVADKQAAPAVERETTATPGDKRVNASDGATEAAPVTSSAPSSTASVLYTIVQDTSSGGSSDPSSSSSSDSSSSSSSSTSDSSSSSSSSSGSDSSSSSSSGDHKRSVRSNSASIESEESPEAKRAPPRPRERRSPQRGRFDGYVLSDFSGFRVGRSARTRREAASDVEVVKMLLEAPIDESILGELPVRRPRQIEQLVPAQVDGVPVTYLVPLPAAPEDPSVVAVSSAPQAPQEPAPAPFSAPADATNLAAGQKVLQIYTVHSPTETPVTTTTPTPAPVAILVPQAAVSNILVPASNVHVDIVPADDAANMTGSVQPALLLEPAVVSVDVPPPGPGPEATPQQAAQVITLDLPAQSSPVLASQDPLAQQALQQAPQDVPQVMVAQTVPAAPQDDPQVMVAQNEPAAPQASQDPLAQQAPQDVPQVMADQPVPAALQTSSPRPFAPAEPAWEQAPAAAAPQEQMAPIYVEPSVQLPPMGFSLPTVDPPGMLLSPPSVSFQGAVPQSGGPRLSAQVQADAAAQSAAWGAAEDAAQRNAEAVEQAAAQGAAQGPRAPQGPLPPRQYFDMSAPWTSRPMGPVGPPTILEKTIQMYPDGSYMYSYETADGVRVAEAGVLKKVPAAAAGEVPDPGAVGGAEAHTPGTRVANSVSGGYSYTAPDGTYFSLRYVADENGFRPIIGEMMDPMASAAPVQAKK